MTRDPITLAPRDSIHHALKFIQEDGISHFPVVSGGVLAGIVSDRDVLRSLAKEPHNVDKLISDVMTAHPLSIREDSSVSDAVDLLVRRKIHSLPVVDKQMHLVGIVTSTDLLKALHETATWFEKRLK